MGSVRLRVMVALSAFLFGIALDTFINTSSLVESALSYPVKALESVIGSRVKLPSQALPFDPSVPTQIIFERRFTGCEDCDDKRLILRSAGTGVQFDDAKVTIIDLHTGKERHGTLDYYYYSNLLKFIEEQGYFEMNDEYAMGWVDSCVVSSTVAVGDRNKSIVGSNEGELPPKLWGIYYALDGALAHTHWEDRCVANTTTCC